MSRVERLTKLAAYVMPMATIVIWFSYMVAFSFSKHIVLLGLCSIAFSAMFSNYFYRRSRGEEAVYGTTRVKVDDDPEEKKILDITVLLFAGLHLLFSIFFPFFDIRK